MPAGQLDDLGWGRPASDVLFGSERVPPSRGRRLRDLAGRRRVLGLAAAAGAWILAPRGLRADTVPSIGLVVPGATWPTEAQRGIELGLADASALAAMFGQRLELVVEQVRDAAGARAAGVSLARRPGLVALLGGEGTGFAAALSEAAAQTGAAFLNVAASDDALRGERCGARSFHLAPSVAMQVDALALWAADRSRLLRWAVIGDGSPRAAEIEAAAARALARRSGGALVAPHANPDLLVLGLEGAGLAAELGRTRAPGTAVAALGGPALASVEAAAAGSASCVVAWHRSLERFSGRDLNRRFLRRAGVAMTEGSWAAWAGVKLVGEAVVRGGARDAAGVATFLGSAPAFDGHKGAALTFRPWDRQLRQPLYIVGPAAPGPGTVGPLAVRADLPGPNLDLLGTPAADTRCRPA